MIDRITKNILDTFILEFQKKENVHRLIQTVVDPVIHHTFLRLYPYVIITSFIFVLTFIIALVILTILIKELR